MSNEINDGNFLEGLMGYHAARCALLNGNILKLFALIKREKLRQNFIYLQRNE